MKFIATFFALASMGFSTVHAHARVHAIFVNDVDQGNGLDVYIRSPLDNGPVKDLTSTDMTCNVGGGVPAPNTIEVNAGDVVTFEWHHESRSASDQIIDPTHKGPVLVYMAPAASNGIGDVWLISERGKHSIIVPDVAPGDYILRPEILALHEADALFTQNPARGVQAYMACVQIKVAGSATTELPAGIAIPGNYRDASPGIKFSLFDGTPASSYISPGGPVWEGAAGGAIGTLDSTNPQPFPNPQPLPRTTVSSSAPAATTSISADQTTPGGTTAAIYQQCRGRGFNGATTCSSGLVCQYQNGQ